MTTPTGTISLNDVNIELGRSGTTNISLNETAVRTLAGVASGTISMNDLRGKSNRVTLSYTFSSSTANASLNVSAIGGYIAGKSDITVTINSGVYLYATSTGNAGLTLTGGTSGDTLTIVNNGFIMGQGGTGGGYPAGAFVNGQPGGTALSLGFATTINNTNGSAYIGGGGGGGSYGNGNVLGGGGAGGGVGGTTNFVAGVVGGSGGSIGSSGGNGTNRGGGGGGRIFAGTGGSSVTTAATKGSVQSGLGGGSGGSGGAYSAGQAVTSGAGGSGNAVGGNASGGTSFGGGGGGGGGGWGANGGAARNGTSTVSNFGLGGKAVALNGNSVTWVSGNTTRVYGAVS